MISELITTGRMSEQTPSNLTCNVATKRDLLPLKYPRRSCHVNENSW